MGVGREWAAFIGAIIYEPAPHPPSGAAGGGGAAGTAPRSQDAASSRGRSTGPHVGL
jgi:hypothetical protein